jgi:tetratricopeptide (TPR) repeat protein
MPEPVEFKYRAFLSYSHSDTSWAKWLHRRLEGYRVYHDLVGRETAMGRVPSQLRPIFRDREEFTAGSGLQEQTIAALDRSAALIVICSPAAAGSLYVTEEIRLFKTRHPQRPIIPVIVAGEPGSDVLECFPSSLAYALTPDGAVTNQPAELVAADVRETGDGRDLALAKTIARLIGVSTDEVMRRAELARRRRLRRWVAGLSIVCMAMAGLAGWAELNRREATVQRRLAEKNERQAKAERDKAEKRLDVALAAASAITNKAISFQDRFGVPKPVLLELLHEAERTLGQLEKQGTDTEELAFRRAKMLRAFATSHASLGNTDKAQKRLEAALEIIRGRRHRHGGNKWDDAYAWTLNELSDIEKTKGNLTTSKALIERSMAISKRALERKPNDVDWLNALTAQLGRLADILSARGNSAEAVKALTRALGLERKLLKLRPESLYQKDGLALAHGKLAALLQIQSQFEDALEHAHEYLRLSKEILAQEPTNSLYMIRVATAEASLGYLLERTGRVSDALKYNEAARKKAEKLTNIDKLDVKTRSQLGILLLQAAEGLRQTGTTRSAIKSYDASILMFQTIVANDPKDRSNATLLVMSLLQSSLMQFTFGQVDDAVRRLDRAKPVLDRLWRYDSKNEYTKVLKVMALGIAGSIAGSKGSNDEMIQDFEKAIAVSDSMSGKRSHNRLKGFSSDGMRALLAEAYRKKGQAKKAIELLRIVEGNLHKQILRDRIDTLALPQAITVYERLYLALWDTNQVAEAVAMARRSLEVAEKYASFDPGNLQAREWVGTAHTIVGIGLRRFGTFDEAKKHLEQGLRIRKELAAADPTKQRLKFQVAVSYARLDDLYRAQRDFSTALEHERKALQLMQELAAVNPNFPGLQEELAGSHNQIGLSLDALSRPDEATEAFARVVEVRERRAKEYARDTNELNQLKNMAWWLANRLKSQGHLDQARYYFEKAKTAISALIALAPAVAQYKNEFQRIQHDLAATTQGQALTSRAQ